MNDQAKSRCCPNCAIRCRCPDPKQHGHEDKCANAACGCHAKAPEQVKDWMAEAEEYGDLHNEDCNVNMEYPDKCYCENMRQIKILLLQAMAETEKRVRAEIEAGMPKEDTLRPLDGYHTGWNSYRTAAFKVIRGNEPTV